MDVDTALKKKSDASQDRQLHCGMPAPRTQPPLQTAAARIAVAPPAGKYLEGDGLLCMSRTGHKRRCTIVDVDASRVKLRYDSFGAEYDEWLEK
eukprot:gene1417-8228_t